LISGCDVFEKGSLGGGPVHVRWLGTAGFALEHDGFVVLIDPYLTRASLARCVASPLRPDAGAIARWAPRADAIVVGHTHFDHALDVPAIAIATSPPGPRGAHAARDAGAEAGGAALAGDARGEGGGAAAARGGVGVGIAVGGLTPAI